MKSKTAVAGEARQPLVVRLPVIELVDQIRRQEHKQERKY